jgi:hypothetical protein
LNWNTRVSGYSKKGNFFNQITWKRLHQLSPIHHNWHNIYDNALLFAWIFQFVYLKWSLGGEGPEIPPGVVTITLIVPGLL